VLAAVLVLGGCTKEEVSVDGIPLDCKEYNIAGPSSRFTSLSECKLPSGVVCLFYKRFDAGGLSCDFGKRVK